MERYTITDAKILTPWGVAAPGWLTVEDGKIVSAGPVAPEETGRLIPAPGLLISAGLIDIHIHGAKGHWGFLDKDGLLAMAAALPEFGVTSFCPSTVSLPHQQVLASLNLIREAADEQPHGRSFDCNPGAPAPTGSRILGAHLEGPYISKKRPGAHNTAAIRDPSDNETAEILAAAGDTLRIATIAPEIPGGMELLKLLASKGVIVSIGHSDADRQQTIAAVREGARLVTHLFNAMRGFHQREIGATFTSLMTPGLYCELIADGKHTHSESIRMAAMLKSSAELILITDAIAAAGMPPGDYSVWGFPIEVKDGAATLPNGTLAGSVLTMDRAVANMSQFAGVPLEQSLNMATCNPAKLLGLLPRAGALTPGSAADFALFTPDMRCAATAIAGHIVFRSQNSPL